MKEISKFLSYVLRHHPEEAGLSLDNAGWTDVAPLLEALQKRGMAIDHEKLQHLVATNEKKRFEFNADQTKIRASQGHSVDVELGYQPQTPPEILYHGTVAEALVGIRSEGLQKMSRHAVHLSATRETAVQVGGRRGKPVILTVRAGEMARSGALFYVSANGVWLTEAVGPEFVEFP